MMRNRFHGLLVADDGELEYQSLCEGVRGGHQAGAHTPAVPPRCACVRGMQLNGWAHALHGLHTHNVLAALHAWAYPR